MSHSTEPAPRAHGSHAEHAREDRTRDEATSGGNSLGLSLLLFLVLFGAFCAGLYVMSLMTAVTFVVGLGIVLLSLFGTFTVVPKFLT